MPSTRDPLGAACRLHRHCFRLQRAAGKSLESRLPSAINNFRARLQLLSEFSLGSLFLTRSLSRCMSRARMAGVLSSTVYCHEHRDSVALASLTTPPCPACCWCIMRASTKSSRTHCVSPFKRLAAHSHPCAKPYTETSSWKPNLCDDLQPPSKTQQCNQDPRQTPCIRASVFARSLLLLLGLVGDGLGGLASGEATSPASGDETNLCAIDTTLSSAPLQQPPAHAPASTVTVPPPAAACHRPHTQRSRRSLAAGPNQAPSRTTRYAHTRARFVRLPLKPRAQLGKAACAFQRVGV